MINWHNAIIAGVVLIWFIGAWINLGDLVDNGKSLEDYRTKFGKDLGMLLFCLNAALVIVAWPPFLVLKFVFGIIRDIICLFNGPKTVPVPDTNE